MDPKLARYVSLIYRGRLPSGAAQEADVTEPELTKARREDEAFRLLEEEARKYMRRVVLEGLYAEALGGNVTAAREYLRRTHEADAEGLEIAERCLPKN